MRRTCGEMVFCVDAARDLRRRTDGHEKQGRKESCESALHEVFGLPQVRRIGRRWGSRVQADEHLATERRVIGIQVIVKPAAPTRGQRVGRAALTRCERADRVQRGAVGVNPDAVSSPSDGLLSLFDRSRSPTDRRRPLSTPFAPRLIVAPAWIAAMDLQDSTAVVAPEFPPPPPAASRRPQDQS
jgi:hypothetical protein